MSTPRSARSRRWASGKSSPTAATRRTWVKKLAEYEKYVADPPSTSRTLPKGVSTLSSATEPTTRRSATLAGLLSWRVFIQEQRELLAGRRRHDAGRRDDGVREEARARARAGRRDRRN